MLRRRLLAGFLSLFSSCSPQGHTWQQIESRIRREFPDVQQLSIDRFEHEFQGRCLLIDVRSAEEYKVSHLPQALHLESEAEIRSAAAAAPDTPVVLYCSVGYRSSRLADRLRDELGTRVWNLDGSIFAWANAGKPIVDSSSGPVSSVHPFDDNWGQLLLPQYRRAGD